MWMVANARPSFCKCQQFALEFLQLTAVINIIINTITVKLHIVASLKNKERTRD